MRTEEGGRVEQPAVLTTTGAELAARYRRVRAFSEELSRPLAVEDYVIQSMPDASPTKWHLAHTSWFFETFVLALLDRRGEDEPPAWAAVVELGLHHEQQHQELLLTDIKHAFHANPLRPAYVTHSSPLTPSPLPRGERGWLSYPAALREIGHDGPGFAFDNESPRHHVFVAAFRLASRPVTNREWLAFMADGGYSRAPLWLSDGWKTVAAQGWHPTRDGSSRACASRATPSSCPPLPRG